MVPEQRRVLVLAYLFPPLGGAGVQRTLKHVKYLPEHGYDPVVVTTRGRWYAARDESLLADVPPGTPVLAAPELPIGRLRGIALNPLHRLRMPWALSLIGWPDPFSGWIPGAVWFALRAVRRQRPDVVYSTSAPASAHVVAMIVSRLTGLPWVADFRDPWTLNPQESRVPRLLERVNAAFEGRLVRVASWLVVADASVELRGIAADDTRRVVVWNGVDGDDLPAFGERGPEARFLMAHIGTLYGKRDAAPILAALERLSERHMLHFNHVCLRIVGNDWRPARSSSPVPIDQTGYVSHREALLQMRAASVLLLYQAPSTRLATGKVFEYLASGRPILCVARPDGEAAALVRAAGAGVIAAPDDPAGIEQAILDLYARWRTTGLPDQPAARAWVLARYSRKKLAGDLAHVLDEAIESATGRPRGSSGDGDDSELSDR